MSGDVIGYVSQCDCGQQVVTRTHHASYTCQRCAEMSCAAINDVDLRGIRG